MNRVYLAGPPFADEYRRRAAALVRERGWEPIDPMRRDFRGGTQGHEAEIVGGDLEDIDSCNRPCRLHGSRRGGRDGGLVHPESLSCFGFPDGEAWRTDP